MKKILLVTVLSLFTSAAFSQVIFDLGLKGGINYSSLSTSALTFDDFKIDLNEESITKMHFGAFTRLGYGRIYVQPEVYYSKKGGDISYNDDFFDLAAGFDYSAVDVPVLLGVKAIKGKVVDFRIMGGPVFTFLTNAKFKGDSSLFDEEFINDKLNGYQLGVGIDVLFLTFDARYEHNSDVYVDPGTITGNADTFMLSVGFKIL